MRLHKAAEKLQNGEQVTFRPKGHSMEPKIMSGEEVTLKPVYGFSGLRKGDIVLAKVNGNIYLHLISSLSWDGRVQISNNKGRINGWTTLDKVYGVKV